MATHHVGPMPQGGPAARLAGVRSKGGWNHACAMQPGSLREWLRADFSIAMETVLVLARGAASEAAGHTPKQ